MNLAFQPVTKIEVHLLKEIGLRTFSEAYQHLNTKNNFEGYIRKAFAVDRLLYELKSEESFFYFVFYENKIVGYLKLNIGESQTEDHCINCLEVERIYLGANFKRRGFGSKMIQFAVDKAKQLNKSKIWLGVWKKNPTAINFYKSQGFVEVGNHVFKFGDEEQIDIIFEKSLNCK